MKERRRRLRCVTIALQLSTLACGGLSPEAQLLMRFFRESRAFDTTAASAYGTTVFNPVTDGIVDSFDIRRVDAERRTADSRIEKEVLVDAQVRAIDGTTSSRRLVITLRKDNRRWLVTSIRSAS